MAIVITNEGVDTLTKYLLGITPALEIGLHLFVNNANITVTSTTSSFVECVNPGYAPVLLDPSLWVGGATLGVASYSYPSIVFTFSPYSTSSFTTVYGYLFEDAISGHSLWGEVTTPSYSIPFGGGAMIISPDFASSLCS